MTERTLVIADTVPNARTITDKMANAIPLSPRSIRHYGGGRGITNVAAILVADSAWPLDDDITDQIAAHMAPIRRHPTRP